jgi:PKHD-type hydroxylase
MFLHVKNVLTPAEVATVAEIAGTARFVDGRVSNPQNLSKSNLQVDASDKAGQKATEIAAAALQRNDEVNNFVFLKRMARPMLARYEVGMKYGTHSDAAFLPTQPQPLRSDVSCTIFISEPASYVGGELAVHLGTETVRIKGEPGSAVFYPSTTLHEVAPVTSGTRIVMLTFIESVIPDQTERELLHHLNEVYALEGLKMDWANRVRLVHVSQSLLRMWSVQ